MSDVTTTTGGNKPRKTPVPAPHTSKLDATGHQISMCIAAIQNLAPFVIPPTPEDSTLKDMDGGCKAATETALIVVCDRLEKIFQDNDRWQVEGFDEHLARVRALAEATMANTESHAQVIKQSARPCVIHNPVVFQDTGSGKWVVMLPGINGARSLMGIGATPAEAMDSFDQVFHERPREAAPEASPGEAEAAPTQPAPRKRKKSTQ